MKFQTLSFLLSFPLLLTATAASNPKPTMRDDVPAGLAKSEWADIRQAYEADGNTTDPADQWDTGIEQRHDACANGGHRGGTVGFHDFRGHADGVGEDGFVRDSLNSPLHRHESPRW